MPLLDDIDFHDFDPNNLSHLHVWAVYNGDVRRFKVHGTRAPALNGFMSWTKAKLYENVGGEWVERACKDASIKNDRCDNCQHSVKDSYAHSWAHTRDAWCWDRGGRGPRSKIVDPIKLWYVCKFCKATLGL